MTEWFVGGENGTPQGPYTAEEMKTKIYSGELSREKMVWHDSMSAWSRASETELADYFSKRPPPLPHVPVPKATIGTGSYSVTQHHSAISKPEGNTATYAAPSRGFFEAISICFSKYATFSGRASRSEYWYWILFSSFAQLLIGIFEASSNPYRDPSVLGSLILSALVCPSFAVGARRLHDIGRSGWWQLIAIIPLLGWILLLVFNCTRGEDERTIYD